MHAILHAGRDHRRGNSELKDWEGKKRHQNLVQDGQQVYSKNKHNELRHRSRRDSQEPASLNITIESPPLVFYGSTSTSSGALLSGRLSIDVLPFKKQVEFTSLDMALNAIITTKKPVAKDCHACSNRSNALNTWNFLSAPKTFGEGRDSQLPFSFLLPGHLPATTNCCLGSVEYRLEAKGRTSQSQEITLIHPLKIGRAFVPGPDRTPVRVFPPTNLTAHMILPPIIHPIGVYSLQLTLSGIVNKDDHVQTRWRLRKLTWRIEEHTSMISPACSNHIRKIGGDGKALKHQDERTIGCGEVKGGWKTVFDTNEGEITLVFDAQLSPSRHPTCDMDSPAGLNIKHNLVIELIVAEEYCPTQNSSVITLTGSARVLRMQYPIVVSERAGMGISWDEETPPIYTDVPASPPMYGRTTTNACTVTTATMEDYDGPELEYVDLERLQSEDPHSPPRYRERSSSEYADVLASMLRDAGPQSNDVSDSGQQEPVELSHPTAQTRSADSPNVLSTPRLPSRLTGDDLEVEPPLYSTRTQVEMHDSSQQSQQEDYAIGEIEREGGVGVT